MLSIKTQGLIRQVHLPSLQKEFGIEDLIIIHSTKPVFPATDLFNNFPSHHHSGRGGHSIFTFNEQREKGLRIDYSDRTNPRVLRRQRYTL
jgi:hypothetical protein